MNTLTNQERATFDLWALVARDNPGVGQPGRPFSLHTSCPFCGGKDRFNLRVGKDGITRAYCNHCEPRGLDPIAYVQKLNGCDFRTALAFWRGGEVAPAVKRAAPAVAAYVAPPKDWQDRANAFVAECAARLWTDEGRAALDYLRGRGLTDEAIHRAELGYNPATLPYGAGDAGITIPRRVVGELWAVNVRRPKGSDPKYKVTKGSVSTALWGADKIARGCIVFAFEGEFDAMLAQQHAPDGVACVTLGSASHNVAPLWREMLSKAARIFLAYDEDAAGGDGVMRWSDLPRVRRARLPHGKDLTEFAQSGGDVAAWLADPVGRPAPVVTVAAEVPTPVSYVVVDAPQVDALELCDGVPLVTYRDFVSRQLAECRWHALAEYFDAYFRLVDMVAAQGGDPSRFTAMQRTPPRTRDVLADIVGMADEVMATATIKHAEEG